MVNKRALLRVGCDNSDGRVKKNRNTRSVIVRKSGCNNAKKKEKKETRMNNSVLMRRIEKKRDTCGKKRNTKEGKVEHSEIIALIQKEEKKRHGGGIEVESVKWGEQWKKAKSGGGI